MQESMENLAQHWFEWLILLGGIAAALYTMRIIRQESSSFMDEAAPVSFQGLQLQVPRWWTQTRHEDSVIQFERTDTRYDWYARFSFFPGHSETSLPDLLQQKIETDDLDYDKDDVAIETDCRVLFRHQSMRENFIEFIRVEGKASEKIENRIYLDLCLFRHRDRKGHYLFESRSSVLNGMVEGPFFEEVLAELQFTQK